MKSGNWTFVPVALLCVVLGAHRQPGYSAAAADDRVAMEGATTTLFAHDDLENSYEFSTGAVGHAMLDGVIYNRNTQVKYITEDPEFLLFGLNGGETATVTELGELRDSRTLHSLFWAVERRGDSVFTRRLLRGALEERQVASLDTHRRSGAKAKIGLGHIYVVAIHDESRQGTPRDPVYFKLLVTDFAPGQHVRFRWSPLK